MCSTFANTAYEMQFNMSLPYISHMHARFHVSLWRYCWSGLWEYSDWGKRCLASGGGEWVAKISRHSEEGKTNMRSSQDQRLFCCYEGKWTSRQLLEIELSSRLELHVTVFCHWATTAEWPPPLMILYVYCTGGTECLNCTPGSHSASDKCHWYLPMLSL